MSKKQTQEKGRITGPFLFVANPNSGTGKVEEFMHLASKLEERGDVEIVESTSPEHSIELAKTAGERGFEAVIAVGGDGSVHEIGMQLIGSDVALGIVPTGSGNGVSRHLGIPNQIKPAVECLLQGKIRRMDTFTANDHPCIGFCGVGIDAAIAEAFDKSTDRGFSNYVKLSIDAFATYEPGETIIQTPSNELTEEVFTVVCANTSQFGNNAYINPSGKDDDGKVEMIIVKHFPPVQLMPLASRLFLKNIHRSKFVEVYSGEAFSVIPPKGISYQIDGEPMGHASKVEFRVNPSSLNVLIP